MSGNLAIMSNWKSSLGTSLIVAGIMTLFTGGSVFFLASELPSGTDTSPLVALAIGVLVFAVFLIWFGNRLRRRVESEVLEERF